MIPKKLLPALLFCNCLTLLLGQSPLSYEVGVLDIGNDPALPGDLAQALIVDDGQYLLLQAFAPLEPDFIYFFDGEETDTLAAFEASMINFLSPLGDGVVLQMQPDFEFERSYYYLSATTGDTTRILADQIGFAGGHYLLNDALFFESRLHHLYLTDGSSEGTVQLTNSHRVWSDLAFGHQLGDRFIYADQDGIWASSGTAASTEQLNATTELSTIYFAAASDGEHFYFVSGSELYFSDGTPEGTLQLTSQPGTPAAEVGGIIGLASTEHGATFIAGHPMFGLEVWTTDGTVAGTQILQELAPGTDSGTSLNSLYNSNDVCFFRGGVDGEDYPQLWQSDGTLAGTVLLEDFSDWPNYSPSWTFADQRILPNGDVYFVVQLAAGTDQYLWHLDAGVPEDTAHIIDTFPTTANFNIYSALDSNRFFFYDGTFAGQVWQIGGSTATATRLDSGTFITSGLYFDAATDLLYYGGTYQNEEDDPGAELYIADGTPDGAELVIDLNPGPVSANPKDFFRIDDQLYFNAFTEQLGFAYYTTDGTAAGTNLKEDPFLNNSGFGADDLTAAGGKLYFTTEESLWVSDGSLSGSQPLGVPANLVNLLGEVGINVLIDPGFNNGSLLLTNGTSDTQILTAIPDGVDVSFSKAVGLRDSLYFIGQALDSDNGAVNYSLLRIDPNATASATTVETVLTTAVPIPESVLSPELVRIGDELFFSWYDETNGIEVWRSNGSQGDGALAFDPTVDTSSYPRELQVLGGRLAYRRLYQDSMSIIGISNAEVSSEDYTLAESVSRLDNPLLAVDRITTTGLLLTSNRLFRLDLATGNTTLLDTTAQENSYLPLLERVGSAYLYANLDSLMLTDGTSAGTTTLLDTSLQNYFGAGLPLAINDQYILLSVQTATGNRLHYYDLTLDTLQLLEVPALNGGNPSPAVVWQERFYFFLENDVLGREIHYLDFGRTLDVAGLVFADENENGLFDEGEPGIPNFPIIADGDTDLIVFTDTAGHFEQYLAFGADYTIYPADELCWALTTAPAAYNFTTTGDSILNPQFGFRLLAGDPGFQINLTSAPIRCGFTVPFWLTVTNNGCTPLPAEVGLQLGAEVSLVSSNPPIAAIEEGQLLWSLDTLSIGASQQIRLELTMPPEEFNGQEIPLTATVMDPDSMAADTFRYVEVLSCAIDPNDKQVLPARPEPSNSNYTQFDETLSYTVRFQNTGTDTAFTVRIEDQLAPSLDPRTLRPIAASHPYQASVSEAGLVIFLFEHIMLPDSNINEPLSHGFIRFEVDFRPTITEGTAVANTAAIYFDFNSPVITNTVTNTAVAFLDEDEDGFFFWEECNDRDEEINPAAEEIEGNEVDENCDGLIVNTSSYALESELRVYPNPVVERLRVQYAIPTTSLVAQLLDIHGRLLQERTFVGATELEMKNLPAGVYFLKVLDPQLGRYTVQKVHKTGG